MGCGYSKRVADAGVSIVLNAAGMVDPNDELKDKEDIIRVRLHDTVTQYRHAAAKYTAGVLAGPQPVQLLRPCEFGGFRQHMNVLSTAARTRPRSRKRGPR